MVSSSNTAGFEAAPGVILEARDGSEMRVDRALLVAQSSVLADLLDACDTTTGRLKLDEDSQALVDAVTVARGKLLIETFSQPYYDSAVRSTMTYNNHIYSIYGAVLGVAHKYDMPLVKERCEKLLLSRLFRVKSSLPDNIFHWLHLCRLYGLVELGHHLASGFGKTFSVSRFRKEFLAHAECAPDDESITLADLKAIMRAVPQLT